MDVGMEKKASKNIVGLGQLIFSFAADPFSISFCHIYFRKNL